MLTDTSRNRACEEYHAPPAAAEQEETPSPFIHSWDIPFLDAFMLVGLDKTFETYKDSLSGAQLFAMFLVKSFYDGSRGDLPTVQTKILITAAERGFVPAQAVAYRVLQSHRQQLPAHISPKTAKTWLFHGASTGSLVAAQDLGAIDMESCERARAEFRRNGGYNQFYSLTARPPDLNLPESESRDIIEKQRNSRIHELATYGRLEYLTELLNDTDAEADVNARNAFGETGLYKACMAGCWQTVSLLSRRGATASITENLDGISCLHWLFNFPPEHIPTVARLLVDANGDPNTLTHTTSPIVQYHFPFTWPPGTPLHWAVAASSATAVKVLLELGADPTLRNRTDAYKYERNVRVFDRHDQSTQVGSYSTTPEGCKGLSAIDLAVAQHDAEVLSLLLARVAEPDLVDEEGYTPLHRLCSLRIGRTVSGARFWYPSFLGAATDSQQTAMLHTISLLQSSINKLTQPRNNVFEIGRGGLTPLMLAIMALNAAAVRALLALGSDIDVSNLTGYTALEVLSHRKEHEPYTSPQAFAAIMDSFVEHYHVANRLPSEVTSLLEVAVSNGLLDIESLLPYLPIDTDKMSFLARLMISEDVFTRDGYLKLPQRDTHLRKHLEVYVAGGGSVCGGDGLLHHACNVGLTGCVSFLISAGAEVNAVVKGTAAVVAGTPLDVVEQRKMQLCDRVESGRSHVSKLGKWANLCSLSLDVVVVMVVSISMLQLTFGYRSPGCFEVLGGG